MGYTDDGWSRRQVAIGAATSAALATGAYVAFERCGGGNGGGMGPRFGQGGGGGGGDASRLNASATASFSTNDGQSGDVNVRWLEEVVMLDVRGMHCGGCAANVRKTLEADALSLIHI